MTATGTNPSNQPTPSAEHSSIRFFEEIGIDDVPLVGGKGAALGESYRELAPMGVRVPNGFCVTAPAYRATVAPILDELHDLVDGIDFGDLEDFRKRAAAARELVRNTPLPEDIADQVRQAHDRLRTEFGDDLTLAVRSSATAEDLPEASFAGAHDTFLGVSGDEPLIAAVQACFASLFNERAIHYRADLGIAQFDVAQSVTVMKMVRSDIASSGVMFTLDTESGFRDVVFITSAYGLGENIVQGRVDPDEFHVFKPTLRTGHDTVLRRKLGSKEVRAVPSTVGGTGTSTVEDVDVDDVDQHRYSITDAQVVDLGRMALMVEEHFSARAGTDRPMDIEWALDGLDGELYLVQARPETVESQRSMNVLEHHRLEGDGPTLASGRSVGAGIATGTVRVVHDTTDLDRVEDGDVLVSETTNPDWEPVLRRIAAVVTDRGGRTCHAAIVAREQGIPAVVGARDATQRLKDGQQVTVSCAEGDTGRVIEGILPFSVDRVEIGDIARPQTRIQMNLGNPDLAFRFAALPNDGVGLARMEFVITDHIGAHPMALIHPERVEDADERRELEELIGPDQTGAEFFVQRLSEGIGTIAAAFHPKPVVVRMSDFKTNEYAGLLGGRWFEPVEANPMLGFRGAARYSHPAYREGFALECAALKRVRNDMGLDNVVPMVPFCRRVAEAEAVIAEMATNGLRRGEDGLEVYVMCEIPNNVISLDAFAEHFDGFSIGSNDLTQLALGVDRDSEAVAFDFDEGEPGVLELFRLAIEGCERTGRHSGFCGQAPSDRPEIARFLVEQGIDAISVNPDVIVQVTLDVLAAEAERKGE